MIRNWYNQIPYPALRTKREITKYINWRQFTKGTRGKQNEQLFPKYRIANSSSCTTTELSKLLTSCLTAVKNHVIRYCEKVYERSGKNLFWSIKNSGEVLNKLKSRGFRATSLSTYDFSTLYTTLPHNLIKEKLINLIEWTFKREGSPYIACNERQAFFTSEDTKRYKLWSCQNVCEALIYFLDNIYIRFGTKLYRQIVGIPMGTNCAPLVADLFLFCYERDFMTSLSDVKQAEIIEAFKSTSRYLDELLNIDNPYFEGMVNLIYPPELQLNKANIAETEAPFLDLHLSISNGFVSSKIYDKRDDFDFDIVNFPFLDGDVPRSTSYGVYISQLIRFARVSSHVVDFNARNKSLTAKLLQQGYRYHKLRKTFSKFYRRHYELVSKFNVGLKTLLHQGLSEPEFYGDLVYKFKKIVGRVDFSDQFRKIIVRYKRIGYNINIMRQSACLVFNPITVNNFASLFNCTPVGRASDFCDVTATISQNVLILVSNATCQFHYHWLDIFGLLEEIDIKTSVAFFKYFSIFHKMKPGKVF